MKKILITLAIIITTINMFGQNCDYTVSTFSVDGKKVNEKNTDIIGGAIIDFVKNNQNVEYMVIYDKCYDIRIVILKDEETFGVAANSRYSELIYTSIFNTNIEDFSDVFSLITTAINVFSAVYDRKNIN